MKLIKVVKSSNSKKKYDAFFSIDKKDEKSIEKKVSFGADGYRDFTLISDPNSKFYLPKKEERQMVKARYIERHGKRENWTDPLTAGALSRYILWQNKNIKIAIKDYKKRFKI